MSLNVIIGKANTGKSKYIYEKIMACEGKNIQAILFVPSSSRVMAEEEYLKYTNRQAIIDTKITSIERFVSLNIDKTKLYKSKVFLPDQAKKMLVRKTILENKDMFNVFHKVKDTTSFTDKVTDYISKFKDIDENFIEKYTDMDFLKAKLEEFVKVYNKVEECVKERFVSSIDELQFYISTLNSSDKNIINADIFIDGYNNFNNLEYSFIRAILLNGNNVTITLDIDKQKYLDGMTQIYNTSYDTLAKLKEICANNHIEFNIVNQEKQNQNTKEDILHLANNIFSISRNVYEKKSDNVSLVLRPNTNEEIKYVAESILQNICEGYKYSDIAVYTNNIDTYSIFLKKIFGMYGIPMYINEDIKITSDVMVSVILTALKLVITDFTKNVEPILNLIKSRLLGIEDDEVYNFENYILEFGIKGYMLKSDFILNTDYNLERINVIRKTIVQYVEDLRQALKNKKTSKEITKVIYNYFKDTQVISRYEEQLEVVNKIDINQYNAKKQVLSKIYEVMDNIVLAYDKITLEEYVNLLEYGINDIKVDTIPAKTNQVEIIDINLNRGLEKKIGYVIGCYDGGLPNVQSEDNIFTDIELEKLKSCGIDLKQTSQARNNMQLFNIYQMLNKVREKLILTVPASLSTGTSLRPSSLIQDIKVILNIQLENKEVKTSLNIDENFMDFLTASTNIDEQTPKEKVEELYLNYLLYKEMPKYKNIMDYLRKDGRLKETTLNNLYKEKINSSVSRLEQYKRCPFAYYSKYVLSLKEKKQCEMTTLDTGSFMHEVIEKVSKYIVAKNFSWQDIVLDEKTNNNVMDEVEATVDKLFKEEYGKYLTQARYVVLKNKLKKAMKRTILAIADSFNHSEFRPLGYEVQFEEGELFAPIEVQLESGKKFYLRGKIDRIDSLKVDNNIYLRIVDYKSSDKNLKLSDIKDGLSLQLMTYMCALLENKEKIAKHENVVPSALSYFTISNKLLNIPNYEQDEGKIKEKLKKALKLRGIYIKNIEVLKRLDNNVEDNKNSYLEVSNRTINNEDKVLPENVFVEECKNIRNILKQIGEEITKGNVTILPNKKVANVCEYCSYSVICRKNILN